MLVIIVGSLTSIVIVFEKECALR